MNSPMPGKRQLLDPTPCGNLITGPAKKNYQNFVDPCGGGVPVGGIVFLACDGGGGQGHYTGNYYAGGDSGSRHYYSLYQIGSCFVVADGIANSLEMGGSGVNLLAKVPGNRITWYGGGYEFGGQLTEMQESEMEIGGNKHDANEIGTHSHVLTNFDPTRKYSPWAAGTECSGLAGTAEEKVGVRLEETKEGHAHDVNMSSGGHWHLGGAHPHDANVEPASPEWLEGGEHKHTFYDWETSGADGESTQTNNDTHRFWAQEDQHILDSHEHKHAIVREGSPTATEGDVGSQLVEGDTSAHTHDHTVGNDTMNHAHQHGPSPTGEDGTHTHDGGEKHEHEGVAVMHGDTEHKHEGGDHSHVGLDSDTTADDMHGHRINEKPHGHTIAAEHQHFAALEGGAHPHLPGDPPGVRLLPVERIY